MKQTTIDDFMNHVPGLESEARANIRIGAERAKAKTAAPLEVAVTAPWVVKPDIYRTALMEYIDGKIGFGMAKIGIARANRESEEVHAYKLGVNWMQQMRKMFLGAELDTDGVNQPAEETIDT